MDKENQGLEMEITLYDDEETLKELNSFKSETEKSPLQKSKTTGIWNCRSDHKYFNNSVRWVLFYVAGD